MGLIGGIARTAVVAGTATAVSNRVSRRQANRWAAKEEQAYQEQAPQQPPPQQPVYEQPVYEEPAPAPAPAALSQAEILDQLKQLGELRTAGVLTDAEFEAQKAKILAGG
ncbi:MAG TPA: SHOCT domain-containing protein [Microlunatus sp.]|nr:SHOCT domain-containing protein [Microlunatus sp.]